MANKPDLWTLVEITDTTGEKILKILASWYGGYGGGDSWKLSSGCETPELDGDIITWPQSSGSIYQVSSRNIGMSGYAQSVLARFVSDGAAAGVLVVEIDTKKYVENLMNQSK